MRLITVKVSNYKSYQIAPLQLLAGFNLITGKNNSGKTALLEAIGLRLLGKPHRSLITVPAVGGHTDLTTSVQLTCRMDRAEVSNAVLIPDTEFTLIPPAVNTEFSESIEYRDFTDDPSGMNLAKWFLDQPFHTFSFHLNCSQGNQLGLQRGPLPSYGKYEGDSPGGALKSISFRVLADRSIGIIRREAGGDRPEVGVVRVQPYVQNSIYIFRAERFNAGYCEFGSNHILAPNASNLAEVLNILQSDPIRFVEFNRLLTSILPEIHAVSVRPVAGGVKHVEIAVWTIPPDLKRPDLTVPLNECGTGVGQVLAMLYVVMTAEYPRTIIIDEPQSFLHPGAARKLMDVLAGFPQHQYVIATHSPTIIGACAPETITVVRNIEGISTLEDVGTDSAERLRIYLAEVGATLSDVFGADDVLWVEGATEEICFPKVLTTLTGRRLMGTVIRGVRSTADFDQKHADAVIDIYSRLAGSSNLLPPAIGFVFDHELRTEQQKQDLFKRAEAIKAQVKFTNRRMYENYLLDSRAIASILTTDDEGRQSDYSEASVASLLATKLSDTKYFKDVEPSRAKAQPATWVHASKLLHDLFYEVTDKRVRFDKTEHSVMLTEWLLEHDPAKLTDIADLLQSMFEARPKNTIA